MGSTLALRLTLGALVFLAGCATREPTSWLWQNPRYAGMQPTVRLVAVLKPEVTFSEICNDCLTRNPEREEAIGTDLSSSIASRLRYLGLTARTDIAGGAELQSAFAQAAESLYLNETEMPAALATAARPLAEKLGADALLIVRYAATDDRERSDVARGAGMAAGILMGAVTGVAILPGGRRARDESWLELALIDGLSGNLIWSRKTYFGTARLGFDIVETALEGFPAIPASR